MNSLLVGGVLILYGVPGPTEMRLNQKVRGTFAMETLTYAKTAGESLQLDLYIPPIPQDAFRSRPPKLIILIHGGGWSSGDKRDLNDLSRYFVGKGFAVANLNYRLAPKHVWPAMRTDVMAAVTYLKREADSLGFDRNGFIAAGESAGGHLSLWLAVEGKVSAVLSISGLHDLSLKMTAVGEKYRIVQKALGPAYPSGIKDFSPLNFVSNSTPPVYFLHGEKDPWVQFEHSTIAESKLKALGVKTRAVLVKGMGHGIKPGVAAEKKALDNFVKWLVKVSE